MGFQGTRSVQHSKNIKNVVAAKVLAIIQKSKDNRKMVNEKGQVRSRASDHKNSFTPETRAIDDYDKAVEVKDHQNKGVAKVLFR